MLSFSLAVVVVEVHEDAYELRPHTFLQLPLRRYLNIIFTLLGVFVVVVVVSKVWGLG